MSVPPAPASPAPPAVLAVIPARGGSKGVPSKNLAAVGGVPLVARAVRACQAARLVTDVVVSTDDPAIAAAARSAGASVVRRPSAIAGDTATSEAAVLHAMEAYEARGDRAVGTVLLVQCTSPFLTAEDVDGVARAVVEGGADSALTVAPFHGFVWREEGEEAAEAACGAIPQPRPSPVPRGSAPDPAPRTPEGLDGSPGPAEHPARPAFEDDARRRGQGRHGTGVNHAPSHRPRRQDRPQDLLETGAAYAMEATGFRTTRHRFFGRTELVRTDPARVLEIDDPHDLARARALAPLLDAEPGALPTRQDVDAVVLDFDGTQTDDRVLIDAEGRELVAVHRGDGLGIAALRRAGLELLILSTETNPVVAARGRKLGVPVIHGSERKDLALKRWCEERGIAPERVLYAGNDVNDLSCFGLVGWPVAVADAHGPVRAAARAVTTTPGGSGAVREIAGWLLGPALDAEPPAGPPARPVPPRPPVPSREGTASS
ncbi:acylneuraminate cytidylyltransferase [Streptomyces sp. SCA3-4]|uniref:acylneuraminate cytidylyltransferase n=1 Tax=Streptomyces sichuanensis TaxID=2871810 RepID=UPI001CE372F6|nr:acylneuraminate cytidylyltransferase [Streptomyces sichuanensis]MCA6093051.1 acylneuraminate cytidylyltransferase [Streptomyces sichuanensis]